MWVGEWVGRPSLGWVITTLAVHGYRSLRDVVLPLAPITVVTGANGVGKSSLYQAFRLMAGIAEGQLIGALARAGGLSSVLWAGPERISRQMRSGEHAVQGTRRQGPVSLMLGYAADELGYLVDVGLPQPRTTLFVRDPLIKREEIFAGPVLRPGSRLVSRPRELPGRASLLDEPVDADTLPEISRVRRTLRSWRFYDSFRVDADAPARAPQVGTHTPVLAHDGRDLPGALATIADGPRAGELDRLIADAFDGARVEVAEQDGLFSVRWQQPGLLRPMSAAELSDGTLRYLLLATALLAERPPSLLVVNEPETSLHPALVPALARLVVAAAGRSQVVVVTHSSALTDDLEQAGAMRHELVKRVGETEVDGQGLLTRPAWEWGRR